MPWILPIHGTKELNTQKSLFTELNDSGIDSLFFIFISLIRRQFYQETLKQFALGFVIP